MARRQVQQYYVTFCLLALGSTRFIASAQNEATDLPDGACYLKDDEQIDLLCSTEILQTFTKDAYVTEQTYCQHSFNGQCYTCIGGSLSELFCEDRPVVREKRGWVRRAVRRVFHRRRSPPRIVNTAPSITCPSIVNRITAPPGSSTAVVTWAAPRVSDRENNVKSTQLVSGLGPGSRFGEGRHTITYKTTDTHGLTAICSVSFTVHVIRCPAPASPSNGIVQCPSTVYGSKCTFRCNTGYQLSGPATAECQQNAVFTAVPTCQKIECGKPPLPSNSKSASCSDGNRYQSVCSLVCSQGYVPTRGARLICSANKKWIPSSWKCEDNEKPVFTNCPTKKINTIDRNFKWTVTATDNTGKVTLKQVQGHPPGSPMTYGTHIIKYVATDPSGNSESCVFTVELKETDCPSPASDDKDMKFTCNGMTSQSVCHLSCGSGSFVQGSKYIACVADQSGNNTSYWEPIDGENATCYKKNCPTLSPPKNGALACDKQLGGTVCQIQCDDRFDVAPGEGTPATFICGKNTEIWKPSNVVPDCLEMAYPDEYSLPTEFFYFLGDCSDPQAIRDIKQQFIDNLNSIGLSPCIADACSVDDIDVTCGEMEDGSDFHFRRKRNAKPGKRVLRVRVVFHVKNSNRTLSPDAAATLLNSLAEKSEDVMANNTNMRSMLFKSLSKSAVSISGVRPYSRAKVGGGVRPYSRAKVGGGVAVRPTQVPLPTMPPRVETRKVTGNLSMECATGSIQLKSKPGVCVPCSVGTYADMKRQTCVPCPQNSYQDKAGRTYCNGCPLHHTTSSTGAATRQACQKLCEKNHFSTTGLVPCFPCPEGTHQPKYGTTTCVSCPSSNNQASPKCLNLSRQSTNETILPPEFQISSFLLTCESEVCLSF